MLDFHFWSIFEAVANIIILFVLLRIFLFKPINKIKSERTNTIQNNLDSAEKAPATGSMAVRKERAAARTRITTP